MFDPLVIIPSTRANQLFINGERTYVSKIPGGVNFVRKGIPGTMVIVMGLKYNRSGELIRPKILVLFDKFLNEKTTACHIQSKIQFMKVYRTQHEIYSNTPQNQFISFYYSVAYSKVL